MALLPRTNPSTSSPQNQYLFFIYTINNYINNEDNVIKELDHNISEKLHHEKITTKESFKVTLRIVTDLKAELELVKA
ncbi:hypothetical protein Fmac_032704 [Flemingia macrophylla]|uniref:Uncharacterized protein n=1 Tax=Flemingia macrophylla TaxID=520843 RepID=A0ABD1L639_9FABA